MKSMNIIHHLFNIILQYPLFLLVIFVNDIESSVPVLPVPSQVPQGLPVLDHGGDLAAGREDYLHHLGVTVEEGSLASGDDIPMHQLRELRVENRCV